MIHRLSNSVPERDGPAAGLAVIDALGLDSYHLAHPARADFLERQGRHGEALDAYDRAITLTANTTEIASPTARRNRVAPPVIPFTPPTGAVE